MPSFSDFVSKASSGVPTNYKIDDILKAQIRSDSDDKSESRLKDISDMFVSAEKQVDSEMKTFGSKEVVDELSKLNKGFVEYANNLSMMKFYLSKFSDENVEVSKGDAEELNRLVQQNAVLVSSINKMRVQDKEFNAKVQELERKNEFHFRSQGVMEVEQQRIQKKYNVTNEGLWKDITSEIDQLKGQIEEDFRTGLLEGFGGPLGTLTKKVFVPGFKAIKDSPVGKVLGSKFDKLGTGLKSVFSDNSEGTDELKEEIVKQGEEDKKLQDVDSELLDETTKLVDTVSVDSDNTELKDSVDDAVDKIIKDVVVPSPSKTKRKVLSEEKVKRGISPAKEPGVFRKLLDESVQSNVYLKDIVGELKDQKLRLDNSYEVLAQIVSVGQRVENLSEKEVTNLLEDSSKQEKLLSDIVKEGVLQTNKLELVSHFNEEVFDVEKLANEESLESDEEDLIVQQKILKELDGLNDKDFGGKGAVGNLGGILGALTTKLGLIGAAVGGLVLVGKGLKMWKDRKDEEATQTLYDPSRKQVKSLKELKKLQPQLFTVDESGYERIDTKALQEFISGRKAATEEGTFMEKGYQHLSLLSEFISHKGIQVSQFKVQNIEEALLAKRVEDLAKQEGWSEEKLDIAKRQVASEFREKSGYGKPKTHTEYLMEKSSIEAKIKEERLRALEAEKVNLPEIETRGSVEKSLPSFDLNTSAYVEPSQLDRDMLQVDKEYNELKAESLAGAIGSVVENNNTNISGSASQQGGKQKLEDISILPEDNFGLVLVNSGINF